MSLEIIFVAGVHGIGKTTFCKSLASKLNLPHFSASDVIRSVKSSAVSNETKKVKNIDKNQDILLQGLNALNLDSDTIILDGHFVLLQDNQIQRLPIATYKNLGIKKIILLTDSSSNIKDRISKRDKSDFFSLELIDAMQKEEVEYAKEVSQIFKVELSIENILIN